MKTISIKNNNSANKNILIALGALIGAATFLLIYGLSPLNPLNDSFVVSGYLEKDVAQHYAGWRLFRTSPWQFPLGVGENMEFPYGGAVSYSDSIPLFAIFFKLFRCILPDTFQYFGIFVLLCFVLQGVFAALLISLFSHSYLVCSIAACFFTFSPIMIERAFRHCALTAHFLIIAGLYYYFKNRTGWTVKNVFPFFIINCLAITIHPYFLPFTFAIMFAFCLESAIKYKKYLLNIMYIFASILSTLLVGFSIGAFHIKGSLGELGYGYFNMNLNSYFNPTSKNVPSWSKIFSQRPLLLGQVEGFNYLGCGIIVLSIVGAVLVVAKHRKLIFSFAAQHFGLLFSAMCLTLFAVGDWVSYGGLKLFRFPLSQFLVDNVLSIFRANGRFGNFLYYLLFLFAIYMLVTLVNTKGACLILTAFLMLQLYDISGAVLYKHNYFFCATAPTDNPQWVAPVAQHPFWEDAVQRADGVVEMESENGSIFGNGLIDIASLCGKYGKYMNSTFAARTSGELRREFLASEKQKIADGTAETLLYVVEEVNYFSDLIQEHQYQAFEVDGQLVVIKACFSKEDIRRYTDLGNFKQIVL